MTDTIEKSSGAEESPPLMAQARPNKLGPTAYGNGPVIAAGVLVGGAVLLGGWGMAQMIGDDHRAKEPTAITAPSDPRLGEARKNGDGTVTVRLPDKDGNGVPDAFEGKGGQNPEKTGSGTATGRGDENRPTGSEDSDRERSSSTSDERSKPKNRVYEIEWGDTLTSISAETGVPVDMLVETNRIQDPNLIYAGSALLIPPTG